ncbi:MAG: hypothetical protein ACK4PH_17845 [Aquincola tertiaricarbonis]
MSITPSELRSEAATIAFVDVVESVRLMQVDELQAVRRIRSLLDAAATQVVPAHGGRVAERRGDGLLLTFADTGSALRCVCQLHVLAAQSAGQGPESPSLSLRAGLHRTTLLADADALYGAGVNLAARIAALGQPGDTLMSSPVRDELVPPLDGLLHDMGDCWLKHVDEAVRIFRHRPQHPPLPAALDEAIAARMRLKPTLVVMPVQALPDGARADLADIATDQLIRMFSRSNAMHVVSALSCRALKGRVLPRQQVYALMRADYVLEPTLSSEVAARTDGHGQVHLGTTLWRRGTPDPIWNSQDSAPSNDLLSPQGELLGTVVHAVSQRILRVEQQAVASGRPLPNLAMHTMYLSAIDMLHRFALRDFLRARELLEAISQRAPRHAEPMAWLARWHVFRVVQGWSDNSHRDGAQAEYYSEQALDRDPCSALALTMAGSVQAGVRRNAGAAQALYLQALKHDPNDSLAWLMSGVAHGFLDAAQPALAASETALGLAPVDPMRHYYDALSATAALRAGDLQRCIALSQRAITANGTHGSAYRSMAIAQALSGQGEAAAETVRQLLAVEPHFTVRTYLARVPPGDDKTRRFAQALQDAGLPAA